LKYNFIGEKTINKSKKNTNKYLMALKKIQKEIKEMVRPSNNVLNFLRKHRLWGNKMLGFVRNVKILSLPKNNCIYTKPQKF
jgi:hypothetical protein